MVDSQAIDATDLVVSVRDRTGRYVLVNRGFEDLTGLPRDRLQGKRDAALNPQDIAEKVSLHDAQVLDTGAPSEVDEELLGREGRVPVRSCRFAICNDEGEPWAVCTVSAARDESDRVRSERDRLAAIADGTPRPHSAVTSERLDTLVADLVTARETASGLTEALEAERNAREEQTAALEAERVARAKAEVARAEADAARAEAEAARAEAEAAREGAEIEAHRRAEQAEDVATRVETAERRASSAEERAAAAAEKQAAAEKRAAELGEQLQRERASTAKLSERVKSLEGAKRSAEGGLLQSVRLRHEHKRLASQLETERRSRQDLATRLDQERKARAGSDARLEELTRDLERKGHELDAAREGLAAARAELDAARAELEARPAPAVAAEAAANGAAVANGTTAPGSSAAAASASLVAVQRRVADLISDASSLEGAMRSGLSAFGELAGWDAAVGWMLTRDGAWLRPASVWCSQFVAGSTFDLQTWQAILDDGSRAIAAAWESTETVWLEDAGAEEDRPRCRWARAAGLTSAAAVPVIVDGEPRGMIEVYKRDRSARDDDVLAALETVATQLGGIERLLELADRPRWR